MLCTPELAERLGQAERLWLFLDYDGTLADFAPTPEHVHPDPEIKRLLTGLAQHPSIRVTVISGRQLDHVATLIPVPGVLLAGTYGVELQTPEGKRINRVTYEDIRPALQVLKPLWRHLISDREGFFLEDKGWALALHARFADDKEAAEVLNTARQMATQVAFPGPFRLLGGHKFLEIGPELAHKGQTVSHLLTHYPWPDARLLYLGDDDKDEEAFVVVKAHGGVAIVVASEPRQTEADCRLESPRAARHWLETLSSPQHNHDGQHPRERNMPVSKV